jgi:hypothetical protein
MAKIARKYLVFVLLCATALPLCGQDGHPALTPSIMGKAIGKLVIDGTPSETTTTIFVKNEVVVGNKNLANVIAPGNSLVFAPNSNFQALHNAYLLKSGGSRVATFTGMTAHLPNCYSVTPVRLDTITQYEVNWSGNSAFVYARKQDVRINYWMSGEPDPTQDHNRNEPDRDWIVKEGHWAKIDDVKLCKPLIYYWPDPNFPTAAGLTAATGFFVSIPFWKDDMSPDHP